MKLTKKELKNLIQEEATRIRKEMTAEKNKASQQSKLEVRKAEIMSEMTGMYGDDVNELFGFGQKETPQQLHDRFKQQVMQHRGLMYNINAIATKNNYPAEKGIEDVTALIVKQGVLKPNMRIGFDPKLQKIVDASKWGVSGAAQSLAETK